MEKSFVRNIKKCCFQRSIGASLVWNDNQTHRRSRLEEHYSGSSKRDWMLAPCLVASIFA